MAIRQENANTLARVKRRLRVLHVRGPHEIIARFPRDKPLARDLAR